MAFKDIYNIRDIADNYEVILFDIWGVLRDAHDILPGVKETVNELISSKHVRFVSNAPRLISSTAKHLEELGFNATEDLVITSGEVGRQMLRHSEKFLNIANPVIYHLGADRNPEILEGFEYLITNNLSEANIILSTVYRDENENISEVYEILDQALSKNLLLFCLNPDTELYNDKGSIRYCAGHFALYYEQKGGKVIFSGKPEAMIFEYCLGQFPHLPKNKFLMVGDTFATDILGGNNIGIDTALVLTGNMQGLLTKHGEKEIIEAANIICSEQNSKPTYLIKIA